MNEIINCKKLRNYARNMIKTQKKLLLCYLLLTILKFARSYKMKRNKLFLFCCNFNLFRDLNL
jgi:hypothetical protein